MSLHHALGVTRNAGRHRPGEPKSRLIPAEHRVPADWTPPKHITGQAAVPADDTTVLYLPPDIDLAEVTPCPPTTPPSSTCRPTSTLPR